MSCEPKLSHFVVKVGTFFLFEHVKDQVGQVITISQQPQFICISQCHASGYCYSKNVNPRFLREIRVFRQFHQNARGAPR